MLDAFDRVFVLNLPVRTDRRAEIEQQLHKVGCRFDSRIQVIDAVSPAEPAGFRTIGAHGCFRSHLCALESALEAGVDSVLILEDDVDFVADFAIRARAIADHLRQAPWSIFYGGYATPASGNPDLARRVTNSLRLAGPDFPIGLSHFVAFHGTAIRRTHAFLQELLTRPSGHIEGGPMDVDGAYSWVRLRHPDMITLIADPQLGYQRASPSDISEARWFDKAPGLRRVVSFARRLKNQLPARRV